MSPAYKRIMVTLDGTPFAAEALAHAEQLALACGAALTLFRVANESKVVLPNQGLYPARLVQELSEESTGPGGQERGNPIDGATEALEHLALGLRRKGLDVTCAVDAGPPAKCIIDYINNNDIDMLVMSTHSRVGLARAMFGSVAQEVVPEVSCPVLLIRPGS